MFRQVSIMAKAQQSTTKIWWQTAKKTGSNKNFDSVWVQATHKKSTNAPPRLKRRTAINRWTIGCNKGKFKITTQFGVSQNFLWNNGTDSKRHRRPEATNILIPFECKQLTKNQQVLHRDCCFVQYLLPNEATHSNQPMNNKNRMRQRQIQNFDSVRSLWFEVLWNSGTDNKRQRRLEAANFFHSVWVRATKKQQTLHRDCCFVQYWLPNKATHSNRPMNNENQMWQRQIQNF